VESPAKCKKIGEILGPNFKVLATMGHIRALEEDLDAVGLDRDFEPRFRFLSEKSKATAPLVAAARNAEQIYLAADDDREGEAIAYSVACLLKRDPLSLPRSVFHEITAGAVRAAIANPRRIDMNRVHAQQARSVLDMMVGFTISPLLWKYVARALSAGRCQTPALRLVSDREREVAGHSTETVWTLCGDFGTSGGWSFEARMDDELEDQDSAMNYMENIFENTEATVTAADQRPWISNPPKPLITSTLQQEASALHKLNPKTTMKATGPAWPKNSFLGKRLSPRFWTSPKPLSSNGLKTAR
jgi:DNA topoisomerase-1